MRVSVQMASVNAFTAYLQAQLGSDVVVNSEWPGPNTQLPPKAITISMAGPRQDLRYELAQTNIVKVGSNQVTATYLEMQCRQPLQLDVWAQSEVERDDLIARLDDALNTGTLGLGLTSGSIADPGVLVPLGDGWPAGTIADFNFDNPVTMDNPDSIRSSEFRMMYSGDCYVMLSKTATTARQIQINFNLALADGDTQTTVIT